MTEKNIDPWHKRKKKVKQRHFRTNETEEEMIRRIMANHDENSFTNLVIEALHNFDKKGGDDDI